MYCPYCNKDLAYFENDDHKYQIIMCPGCRTKIYVDHDWMWDSEDEYEVWIARKPEDERW